MKRDIEKELLLWKNDQDRMPLIIRGARQVGKTFTIRSFGIEAFESLVILDFEKRRELKVCFDTLDPHSIVKELELVLQEPIIPGKTLLFLDEIQECPMALKSLRYFMEELPQLHVIAAGSLLEFALEDEGFSFPVGRVQFMYMNPLSFMEFLCVLGNQTWSDYLHEVSLEKPLTELMHVELLKLVSHYFLLGGMPKVIQSYLHSMSFLKALHMQSAITTAYYADFSKYGKKMDVNILRKTFDRAAELLGKQCKYAHIDPHEKRPDITFKNAIQGLTRAGILHQVFAAAGNGLPLRAEKNEKKFKLIYSDIGLLQSMMGLDPHELRPDQLMQINRGALAEQFVGQELLAYVDPYLAKHLYYWQREKLGSLAEVDYLFGFHGKPFPIEVKAGKTGSLRSLKQFLDEKSFPFGIRISERPLSFRNNVLSVPFYLISQLPRLLSQH